MSVEKAKVGDTFKFFVGFNSPEYFTAKVTSIQYEDSPTKRVFFPGGLDRKVTLCFDNNRWCYGFQLVEKI